jgi:rhomboid protease GluP
MQAPFRTLPCQSRKQALEWSLVLTSQHIETIIDHLPETEGWVLLVQAQDYGEALRSIQQYVFENREHVWRHPLDLSDILFHWGVIFWAWLLVLWHRISLLDDKWIKEAGLLDSALVKAGEWWRLFTAICLHANASHLLMNITIGSLILGFAMARYGAGLALLVAYIAGALGNVGGILFHTEPYRGLGASGMIMAGLGLLVIHPVREWLSLGRKMRKLLVGIAAVFMLFSILGANPDSDVIAHFSGFVAGVVFGFVFALIPIKYFKSNRCQLSCTLILLSLVVGLWMTAIIQT